jgi:hypothetical protein
VHGLLSVGAGGVLSELLTMAHALLPIDRTEPLLINQLRCAPMLSGFRNQPVSDRRCWWMPWIRFSRRRLLVRLLELVFNPLDLLGPLPPR